LAAAGHAPADTGSIGRVAQAASTPQRIAAAAAAKARVRMRQMGGFWIILVEIAVVLAIATFVVWWTTKK
jgi:hypothetical protein